MRIFDRNKGKIEIEKVTIDAAVEQAEVFMRLESVESELSIIRDELKEIKQKVEDDC